MRSSIMFLAAVLSVPVVLFAQPPGPGWNPDQHSFERIQQLMKMRMVETLELKEEQSVRFIARFNDWEGQRRDLMKQKGEALDRIDKLIKENADEKELEKAFPAVFNVDAQMAADREKFFGNLSDILTITQRAKLLLFERKFERELRDAVRETQRRRMRGEEAHP